MHSADKTSRDPAGFVYVGGMFYTYVLFSHRDRRLYIGFTANLERRFEDHLCGRVESTRDRRPLELIYYEAYPSAVEAERRESYLKGGNGREVLKEQLRLTFERLHYRSRLVS